MLLKIHPVNPQRRLILQVVDYLKAGGIVVIPTDTNYGVVCDMYSKAATTKLYQFRKLSSKKLLSVLCADLKQVSEYALISTVAYRKIRKCLPGPYTFILQATNAIPKHFDIPRKQVGIRIPNHPIPQGILDELGHPLLITSILPEEEIPSTSIDPQALYQKEKHIVDAVVDAGVLPFEQSTVVDFTVQPPQVVRVGKGDLSLFESA
jgi:tRNA threonylcarbamoyl adenosine modification protein (Sua5/YciO/YrdC/YwlC family)